MSNVWEMEAKSVAALLKVEPEQGLSNYEVKQRLKEFGFNKIESGKKISPSMILIRQFKSPIIYLLVVAILISFILKEYIESISILVILLLNAIIGFFQEYKAEISLKKLTDLTSPHGRVRRNSTITEVSSTDIVPGDVLFLEAGDYVVADARLIQVNELSANESILTGESLPVTKHINVLPSDKDLADRANMIFAGTAISRGSGLAIAVATGEKTEMGKIAGLLKINEKSQTPIQRRLEILGHYLLASAFFIILLIFGIGYLQSRSLQDILMSALSLSIAVIPEGLPAMVTVALLVAVFRMSKKGALVRRLDAVETLGATDIICTDKTGTLTYGRMEVENIFSVSVESNDLILFSMGLCNNASIIPKECGDTTEVALLKFIKSNEEIQAKLSQFKRIKEWPFDSDRKRMSVAVEDNAGHIFIFTKGAPESLLPHCENELNSEGQKYLNEGTHKGKRLLAFAYKKISRDEFDRLGNALPESNLVFLGLTALSDQLREESKIAINKCHRAGIKVVMITGDHPSTANSIAKGLSIGSGKDNEVLTGKDLDQLSEQDLSSRVNDVYVYARVTSEQKYKIVNALLKKGHIVAMTGDGVNDAPALKKASVGVAMGRGGTEVARQASSMVLTNDDFATIVSAIEEGRGIFGNLKRTLQYLLSTNLAELLFILFAIFLGLPVPLLPINILWINLVTDGLPALALASEEIPEKYLEQSKRPSTKSFFDKGFFQELFIVGIAITLTGLGIYCYVLNQYDIITSRSLIFSFMVYVILLRSFSCRSDDRTFWQLRMNWIHLGSVLLPLIFQIFFQYSSFLRDVFMVGFIPVSQHLLLLVLAFIPVLVTECYKIWFIQRR